MCLECRARLRDDRGLVLHTAAFQSYDIGSRFCSVVCLHQWSRRRLIAARGTRGIPDDLILREPVDEVA